MFLKLQYCKYYSLSCKSVRGIYVLSRGNDRPKSWIKYLEQVRLGEQTTVETFKSPLKETWPERRAPDPFYFRGFRTLFCMDLIVLCIALWFCEFIFKLFYNVKLSSLNFKHTAFSTHPGFYSYFHCALTNDFANN